MSRFYYSKGALEEVSIVCHMELSYYSIVLPASLHLLPILNYPHSKIMHSFLLRKLRFVRLSFNKWW